MFKDIVREAAADDEDGTIEIINPSSTAPYSSDADNEEDHRPLLNGRLMLHQYSSPYIQFYDYINNYYNNRRHNNIVFDQLNSNLFFRNHPYYQHNQHFVNISF